jgi:hypothetical protein
MKMCQPHWDALRDEVKALGMWHLVSRNGEEAAARAQRQIAAKKGEEDPKDYDPLMDAHMLIMNNAIQAGGAYLLTGDYCPLCELDLHKEEMGETSKDWITKSVDGCRGYCIEKKLLEVH